jgi:hypothetical protein
MATYAQALPALTTSRFRPKWESGASNAVAFSTASYPLEPTSPAWLQPTIQSFLDLLQLPQDWDGYGANQMHEQIVQQALLLLVDVMDNGAPPPSVVPLSDGGVQVEWHRHGRNLEIEFPADEPAGFYYYEDNSATECEGPVARSYDQLQRYTASLK